MSVEEMISQLMISELSIGLAVIDSLVVGTDLGLGVEMFEGSGLDTSGTDERVDLGFLQADHSPELVGRNVAFVDELVQRAQRDTQTSGSFGGAEPANFTLRHVCHVISSSVSKRAHVL